MRRNVTFVMAAIVMFAGVLVWSQGALAQGSQRREGFSPDRAVERLAERLNLTEEQKGTVQNYLQDQRSQMEVLRNDTTLTREQRAQRTREITQSTRDKIQSILTVEQRQRAEDLRNQARERGRQRVQEQFDRTARLLDLTEDQKTQFQSYLENERTQLQSLRENTSLTQEERRAQARTIREQTRSDIRSLLNSTQQQRLEDLRGLRRGGFGGGRQRGGPRGPGGGPGGPRGPRGQGQGR